MMTFKTTLTTLFCSSAMAGILGTASLVPQAYIATSGTTNPPDRLQASVTAQNTDSARGLTRETEKEAFLTTAIAHPNGQQAVASMQQRKESFRLTQQQGRSSQPAFNRWPDHAKPVEKWMYGLLDKRCPENMKFREGMSLAECLEFLADHFSIHHPDVDGTRRRLRFRGETMELELEGLEGLDEIQIETDIELDDVTLENALDILLADTGGDPELAYEIRNEIFFITTAFAASERLSTRVYNVPDLLRLDFSQMGGLASCQPEHQAPDSHLESTPFFASLTRPSTEAPSNTEANPMAPPSFLLSSMMREYEPGHPLRKLVIELTSPPLVWIEYDGEGGTVQVVGDMLVVRQSHEGHREVVNLLNQLTAASEQLAVEVKQQRKLSPESE